jgi:hypothetical protein
MPEPNVPLLAATNIESLAALHIEDLLLPVLLQVTIIIAAARLFGALTRRVGQPAASSAARPPSSALS